MELATTQDVEICLQLLAVWKRMKATIEDFAVQHGMTSQQIFMLYSLYSQDSILMGTLAKNMHCDASNVTGVIERLQLSGLVVRREMPEDRRAKLVSITSAGKKLIESLMPLLPASLNLASLSDEEVCSLRTSLHTLIS